MRYSEAFAALGYRLENPRQDWSAVNASGVCISLWRCEIAFSAGKPRIDTRLHCGPEAMWHDLPGNKKRMRHLMRAATEYGGHIDVVIVDGKPGHGVDDAAPWESSRRKGSRWRITDFAGHFRAAVNVG